MNSALKLKKHVQEQIDLADDRLLRLVNALIESYQNTEGAILTPAQKDVLDDRLERYERGQTSFYSLDELKKMLNEV